MNLTSYEIESLTRWWIEKSRKNFLAYRMFMRPHNFINGWFIESLCGVLQQFYIDLKNGKRPILLIQAPPQHGKSWTIIDFIAWLSGLDPRLRIIYASFSAMLGIRCNSSLQRYFEADKHKEIFPDHRINENRSLRIAHKAKRTSEIIEYLDGNGRITEGQFRNTTVRGRVTGEGFDIGFIDDVVKGSEEANSLTISEKTWEWFTVDFLSRFSEYAGLVGIMTRWSVHDVFGRLLDIKKTLVNTLKVVNFQAIATKDEVHRKLGEPLFPELKSLEFLKSKKVIMSQESWEALYQGNPTVSGGNKFKDHWWKYWEVLPPLKYKFITADTSQKTKDNNDFTVFQCWGRGIDDNIYLLDKMRDKWESPDLRREAHIFYRKHDTKRKHVNDPILRGMYIEDKSSGIGLIQELRRDKLKVYEVPRHIDKLLRADDASPYVEAGRVYLNKDIEGIDNLRKEAREFPNSEFDDDIDTLISAIEISFINHESYSLLTAALAAD